MWGRDGERRIRRWRESDGRGRRDKQGQLTEGKAGTEKTERREVEGGKKCKGDIEKGEGVRRGRMDNEGMINRDNKQSNSGRGEECRVRGMREGVREEGMGRPDVIDKI